MGKLIKTFSTVETLRNLKVGEQIKIPQKKAKVSAVRMASYRMKDIKIQITEAGMKDGCIATRLS